MIRIILLAALVVLLAGCGSTTTIVTRTRTVRPCANETALARCVRSVFEEYARAAGFPRDGMRSECAHAGSRWMCTVLTLDEVGQPDCRKALVAVTRLGFPAVLSTGVVFDGSCDRWTS